MKKETAIVWMRRGAKLEHRYFSTGEWITIGEDGLYHFEDGVECTHEEFWKWHTSSVYDDNWYFVGDAYTSIAARHYDVTEDMVNSLMRNTVKDRFFAEICGSDSTIISDEPPMTKAESGALLKECNILILKAI